MVVLAGDTMSAVGSGLTLPFFLVYLSRVRDIDLAVAGLALSTVALAGLAGNPLGGSLTDRVGAKRALVCGLFVAAGGAFSVTLVREPWHAFVAAGFVGLGMAVVTPARDALLATVVSPSQRPAVFAVRNATLNAGYGIGGVGAALVADLASPSSFVTLYVVDGLTFLLFIPVLVLMLPPDRRTRSMSSRATEPKPRKGYRDVLRDRVFLRVWLLVAVLVGIGFAQTLAGFPAYATGARRGERRRRRHRVRGQHLHGRRLPTAGAPAARAPSSYDRRRPSLRVLGGGVDSHSCRRDLGRRNGCCPGLHGRAHGLRGGRDPCWRRARRPWSTTWRRTICADATTASTPWPGRRVSPLARRSRGRVLAADTVRRCSAGWLWPAW
jgi:hypothetical protein